jgi:hypothetical protein
MSQAARLSASGNNEPWSDTTLLELKEYKMAEV